MKHVFTYRDCIGRFEDGETHPTEWENFPIHHTDPLWNAGSFYPASGDPVSPSYYEHGQTVTLTNKNELVIRHDVPSCHEDPEMDHVTATFRVADDHLYVYVRSNWAGRAIWIGPSAAAELRDYLNNNPF